VGNWATTNGKKKKKEIKNTIIIYQKGKPRTGEKKEGPARQGICHEKKSSA